MLTNSLPPKFWFLPMLAISVSLQLLLWPAVLSAQSPVPSPAEAMALEQQGKLDEAAQAWQAVIRQNPRDASALASLGVVFAKQQKYSEAASAYKKALALNPKLPGIQLNLGLAEFKQGRFEAAVAPLNAALAAQPSSIQARTLLGLSYYGAKQFAEASKHLGLAAKADPDNTQLRQVLAQSCLWAKKFDCALEEFRLIAQHDPNSAAAHVLMGEALDGLGKTAEAIAEFQEAIKAAPQEPNVHFGLGYLHWKLKQYDEAEIDFKAELSVDPGNAQALAYLGDVAMKKNDPETALTFLNKAIASRKDIRIAYLDLGAILSQQGHHPEAIVALQRAVELDPEQPDAHFRLGRVYQASGDEAAAQKEFAKVRELHNKSEEDVARKMSAAPPPLKQ